jgi:hypothetical protein
MRAAAGRAGGVRGGARGLRPRGAQAAAGRAGGVRGGVSGRRPRGARAAAAAVGRAGRETGCLDNGGKRGLERGRPSVMAATECVWTLSFAKYFSSNEQSDADRADMMNQLLWVMSFSEMRIH